MSDVIGPGGFTAGDPDGSTIIEGTLEVKDHSGATRLRVDSSSGMIFILDPEGKVVYRYGGYSGGISPGGRLIIKSENASEETFNLQSDTGTIWAGNKNISAKIVLKGEGGKQRVLVNADRSNPIGVIINQGEVLIYNKEKKGVVSLTSNSGGYAHLGLGNGTTPGRIMLFNSQGERQILLDGNKGDIDVAGDIRIANADLAEDFFVDNASPGAVMVMHDGDVLQPCDKPYDTSVVGIISGEGELKPGIILDRQNDCGNRSPIALAGKTFCRVTADGNPIALGDLLTTSEVTGHAMKASDTARAHGAILGKALRSLSAGRGVIPVLVSLH